MEQELNAKDRELVSEAYIRYQIWKDGCKEIHDRAKESRLILRLQDPRQNADQTGKPVLQLQTLKSTFNNSVADQMDNMPEAIMLPEREELKEVAEDLTDIVRFVMHENDYETLHRKRVEDFFCTGTSITQVAWDSDMDGGRGNIALLRFPIESFLYDPACDNIQESRAIFKVSWHPMSWYEQHFPDKYMYVSAESMSENDVGVPDAQENRSGADEDRASLLEYWYRKYNKKKKRYEISVAYLAGGALLEHMPNVYSHGRYPFVVDVFTPIEGLPVGDGLIQELAPMMRYINRYAAYVDMNLRMSSKARLLVNRNAGIDEETLEDWTKDIIKGDRIDSSALQWLQTQPFTGMVSNQMLQFQTDMKQDAGQNQFTRGETAGGVTAASAISALQEAGGKISRLRTSVLNQGFKEICEQIMWLISQYYDSKRIMYITGKMGEQRQVNASPKHLFGNGVMPPPPYSVQVQVQRRNPLRVQAQNELFMQAYSMSAQAGQNFPLSALFSLLNVDGKERVLPYIEMAEQQAAQMQALQEQNSQMQAQIQEQSESIAGLKELTRKYATKSRGAMYPKATATDEPLPNVEPL